jgi:peptide/nickel transport system permease protein
MSRSLSSTPVRASDAGGALVLLLFLGAMSAPLAAPHSTADRFPDLLHAPPTRPRIVGAGGGVRAPFIYPWKLVNRLEQRFELDTASPVPLRWFAGGRLVTSDDARMPLLLLGADSYGRDVFSRLLFGARVSITLSIVAALGSMVVGGLVGAVSGYASGSTDEVLMRATDMLMVLPTTYVVLALRAVLPLVLAPAQVFALLAAIFTIVGAPFVSRGVRGVVRTESRLEYAAAALSLGAGHARLLWRHLLPAAAGFLAVQVTLLVPGFIVAEALVSFVGLGFPEPVASWGTMLQEAANVRTFSDFPWLLSPAAAIFLFVLGLNLLVQQRSLASPRTRRLQ